MAHILGMFLGLFDYRLVSGQILPKKDHTILLFYQADVSYIPLPPKDDGC